MAAEGLQKGGKVRVVVRWRGGGERNLEGLLDGVVHHVDVGLVHLERLGGQPAGREDGDALHVWAACPVVLQDQQQLLHTSL